MTAERAWDPSLCCGPSSRKEGIYSSALGRSSVCFVSKAHKAFLWWWAFRWFKFHNVDLSWKWATVPVDSEAIPDRFRWAELWIWVQQMVLSPQMILWLPEWSAPGWQGCPTTPFHLQREGSQQRQNRRLFHMAGLSWLPVWELGPWHCFHGDCSHSGPGNNELLSFMTQWGSWMDKILKAVVPIRSILAHYCPWCMKECWLFFKSLCDYGKFNNI